MAAGQSSVLIVDLETGSYMGADHYALVEHGMPDGYEVMRDVSNERWLNAIAEATGHEPSPLAKAGLEEKVLVDLSTGTSRSRHMAIGGTRGGAGWTVVDELGPVDMLDALREARGLDPVDRSDFEETPFGGSMKV